MAHVQLRNHPNGGALQVMVNGVDLSMDVLNEGFALEPADGGAGRPITLHLVIAADTLDADLDGVQIVARRSEAP